ncbi:MAG: hypothetical protein CMD46_02775 [Gammaproteobacteria bacterium]|mgnify:FL=1|nr:hypothetical protein [Gammaproteobacteria bacterium]
MIKLYLIISILIPLSIFTQETEEEIPIEEQRNNAIKQLLETVEINKSIYVADDKQRIDKFLNLIDERENMLAKAKNDLRLENERNTRLEKEFEENEKVLAELEERLQIKIGVLGELFGVARQFAGELLSSSESAYTFTEFPERGDRLKEIGKIQVHSIEELEVLWLEYFNEIVASGEVKELKSKIINSKGDSFEDNIVRYGLFSASYKAEFIKPIKELNGFELLQRQPENSILRNLKRHQRSDEYRTASIDPTRGFLLSLYLDKAGWIERIAQGKSVGFIIILIGIIGVAFSSYKIYFLNENKKILEDSTQSNVIQEMIDNIKQAKSYQSKENIIDELISNYSSKLDWGVSWIKFVAAVAPLLGLLGTVIGMIETFQAITLFGTGDPKQMAGGISQALITTMLGLMVAAPLLGFYTYISDRVNTLIQVVEEKGSYLLSKE